MNLKTIKYKAIAVGLIAMLFASGCKDFLERDIEDGFSTESVQTKNQYLMLTGALYGGTLWLEFNDKYGWAFNEGLSGNLYNTYDQEGAFFKGQIAPSNDILEKGYTSLYSGVISATNYIINKDKSTLSSEDAREIEAEARMFRGMAYFLATECWGEVPLVLNNEYSIVNKVRLPRANRATIYAVIEKDWQFAAEYLTDEINWGKEGGRVSKWGAKGMLAKLYLTMASCQTDGLAHPYVCPNPAEYYQKAVTLATEVINNSGAQLVPYAGIFGWDNMRKCNESLFALHFEDYGYDTGSHYQAQMGKNTWWAPQTGWGGGKSLTYTLYRSYKLGDARKKEVCMFNGEDFFNYRGEKAEPFGKTAISGAPVMNNIKKFVYGYNSTRHPMSCNMRLDFLRLADVYLMRAEANMALAAMPVDAETSAGISDLRAVVAAHAGQALASQLPEVMAFYKSPGYEELTYCYNGPDKDGAEAERCVSMSVPKERTDFIQERRKEFAIEGHGWLDIKRLYYRNPQAAKDFLKEQDRGWSFKAKFNVAEVDPGADETERGYVRTALFYKLLSDFPNISADGPGEQETTIDAALLGGTFNTWFLPLPSKAVQQLDAGTTRDFVNDVLNGTYPY